MAERPRKRDDDPPVQLRPIRFRGGGFAGRQPRVAAVIAVISAIAVWGGSARQGWLSPTVLPSPLAVLAALRDLVVDGALWQHIAVSLQRLAIGWSIGTAVGLVVGLAIGLWSLSRAIGLPVVSALYPIPQIA